MQVPSVIDVRNNILITVYNNIKKSIKNSIKNSIQKSLNLWLNSTVIDGIKKGEHFYDKEKLISIVFDEISPLYAFDDNFIVSYQSKWQRSLLDDHTCRYRRFQQNKDEP